MVGLLLINRFKSKWNICYSSFKKMSDKTPNIPMKDTVAADSDATSFVKGQFHIPNKLERAMLVWTKMYKSKEDIPKRISIQAVERARNKARIKLANYMMLATAIACVFVAISGRRAAERGESVTKMNLDWHRKINEESAVEKK